MPGRAPRQKGNRFEREIVEELRAAGLDAHRIPLSGAQRGFKGDVQIRLTGRTLTLEAKVRASGFSFIYKAIDGNDALAVKVDRQEPLLILRLSDAAAILGVREGTKVEPAQSTPTQVNSESLIGKVAKSYDCIVENGLIGAVDTSETIK